MTRHGERNVLRAAHSKLVQFTQVDWGFSNTLTGVLNGLSNKFVLKLLRCFERVRALHQVNICRAFPFQKHIEAFHADAGWDCLVTDSHGEWSLLRDNRFPVRPYEVVDSFFGSAFLYGD